MQTFTTACYTSTSCTHVKRLWRRQGRRAARRKIRFALCGSSARRVRRGAANLLGGRAVRYELHGLTAAELRGDFDLVGLLNHGYLPSLYESDRPERALSSYVGDYLKEEVAAEGLVRNLPVFSAFLGAAALSDGDLVNVANIARGCGVSGPTVKGHFGHRGREDGGARMAARGRGDRLRAAAAG